jgi:hypothetical protein
MSSHQAHTAHEEATTLSLKGKDWISAMTAAVVARAGTAGRASSE